MYRLALPLALTFALTATAAAQTVTFEGLPFAGTFAYENGAHLAPPGSFASAGAAFNNAYTPAFDSWSGWSYSKVVNTTTAGFGNQYAAYNLPGGGGDASANYGVAFSFSPGDATTALPANTRPSSARLTNTTYAALSMLNGDPFAKKFGGTTGNDPDFFLLTITGTSASGLPTGAVNFYLADYRFADNSLDYVVKEWTTVNLSSLSADTTKLSYALTSSDNDPVFGINTPAYFAADNLVLTPVPEPGAALLLAAGGVGAWRMRRRRAGLASARAAGTLVRDTPPARPGDPA